VIVLVIKMAKAFGNRFQSRSFGLLIERVVGVGSIGDLAEEDKRAVVGQFVFFSGSLRTNIPYRDGRARTFFTSQGIASSRLASSITLSGRIKTNSASSSTSA
jgi:hypothetical protein